MVSNKKVSVNVGLLLFVLSMYFPAWAANSTSTTLNISPSLTVSAGTVLTFTATVTSGGLPVTTGFVKFCDASAAHCEDSALLSSASVTSSGTAVTRLRLRSGTTAVTAVFQGTNSYAASTSPAQDVIVAGLSTNISASGSTGNYTLTGSVKSGNNSEPVTGTISFLDASNGNYLVASATMSTTTTPLSFTGPTSTKTVAYSPNSIVVGDFNGDGILDIAEFENYSTGANERVDLLLGNGNGTFTWKSTTTFAYVNMFEKLITGDFNNDGKLDIAAVGGGKLNILLGNGDGTFTVKTTAVSSTIGNIVASDLNGDGRTDLVALSSGGLTILLGNGDGTFTSGATVLPQSGLAFVGTPVVGDFDGNGTADIAVITGSSSSPFACSTQSSVTCGTGVDILLGNGNGTFTWKSRIAVASGAITLVTGDFNDDGTTDLAIGGSPAAYIYLGKGDGTFNLASSFTGADTYGSGTMVVGDFNDDGKTDLMITETSFTGTSKTAGTVYTFLGNGDGTFTSGPSIFAGGINLGGGNYISEPTVAVGDFNGNGRLDVTSLNGADAFSDVFLNQGGVTGTATVSGIAVYGGGTHNVFANYSGDTIYPTSQSGTVPLNGTRIPTSNALTLSPGTTEPYSTALQLTAGISPYIFGTYNAAGTVTFYDGATSLGSASVSSGQAAITNNSLAAGSHSLTAVYAGDSNFANSTSAAVVVNITNIPTITWANPAAITYGTALNGAQLDATASVPGIFMYSPAAGTILGAGTQTLSVTFTPTDTTHYSTANASVTLVVNKAPLTVTANNASKSYGAVNPSFSANYSGFVNGDTQLVLSGLPSLTTTATSNSPVGTYTTTAMAGTLSAANYTFAFVNGTLTINKASSTITVASSLNPSTYGTSVTFTITIGGSGAGGTPTGTANIMLGGTTLLPNTAINASGQTAYTTSTLSAGADTLTVNYSGDSNYQ